MSFSVLMSVYSKENPLFFDESLNSIACQSLQPSEIILVEDGPIPDSLATVIEKYSSILPIKSVRLEKNGGLAAALNLGLKHCSNEIVARMDTDDVSLPYRFEKQVCFMLDNPDISVSSAWIEERDESLVGNIMVKKLPANHNDIYNYSKRRCPINHPVSIFKRSAIISVGGYPSIFPEDYALWSLMLVNGFRFANIPDVLLHMRTGSDFIKRRGFVFLRGEVGLLKYQKAIGFFSVLDCLIYFFTRAVVRMSPPNIRKLFYRFLR